MPYNHMTGVVYVKFIVLTCMLICYITCYDTYKSKYQIKAFTNSRFLDSCKNV